MANASNLAQLALFLLALLWTACPKTHAKNPSVSQWPLHDDSLNDVVQWDHYSFEVDGKRVFIFAGEMHYWRLPVPEMWEDVLQKIKAAGCNAFTFYGHWGYHAPSPDTLDFENGAHNFTRLFELAHEIGLYVFVRPGPYINAEANAGGFPLWLTTGDYGTLRNNDTRYTGAWEPYTSMFAQITAQYQVSAGQNALAYQIENEYGDQWDNVTTKQINSTAIDYMELLEANARSNGIDVPLTHNNPNMYSKSWSQDFAPHVGGDVDVYGLDSYPACWSCNLAECITTNGPYIAFQVQQYYEHFQQVAPTQPGFMPEFQGGSYNPWGGPEGGCIQNSNEDFANLYYRHNIAEHVTAMSLYMFYGGTSWGWFAAPVVATSYDYSAPISEDRSIGAKYYETKNLALFTRVAEDLRVTNRIANSTAYTHNDAILTTELRNPETNAGFYVTRHTNSSLDTYESFRLNVTTSLGKLTIPQRGAKIVLNGHQSKIIVTDFNFGSRTLAYSTAEILTYAVFDDAPTLALWVPTGESSEFYVKGAEKGSVSSCQGCSDMIFHKDKNGLLVTFKQNEGMTILKIDDDIRIIVLDRTHAYPFWVPALTADPLVPVNETVLVQGPYLVRSASLSSNAKTIELTGDSTNTTRVEVFAPKSVTTISWNGKALKTKKTAYGSFTAQVPGPATSFTPPTLNDWKSHDSLPERLPSYNASGAAWVSADHMETPNPNGPPATLPVLYVDDYGFHNGIHLWRGVFYGHATKVHLNVQGGTAFGWSAWLNGNFIGSWLGNLTQFSENGELTLSFHNATFHTGTNAENVLLVLQDNSGHDETSGALNPRGIINATLLNGSTHTKFSSWRVAGTAGGSTSTTLDPVRGALAEGGLTAERLGWHLPGFGDSAWSNSSPSTGFSGAGVKFYRTQFALDTPVGHDISLSFHLSSPASKKVRSLLFVNGYQYGRYNPWMGNQVDFPIPPGILDYTGGENTVGLAVWAQSMEGAKVGVELKVNYVTESSFDVKFNGTYLRPGWTETRLKYA